MSLTAFFARIALWLVLGAFLPLQAAEPSPAANPNVAAPSAVDPKLANPKVASQALIRLEGPIFQAKMNASASLLAFTDTAGRSLRILDLKTHEVIEVTPHRVGAAFFWSPDGVRLFYRELIKKGQAVESLLQAFDAHLNQSVLLETIPGSSGYLTYAPYQQTAYLLHEKGILAKRLDFPGLRLANWQKKKPTYDGQWIATQSAILWLTDLGLTLKKMEDDGSGVASFSISPDGQSIAWASEKGLIYTAQAAHPEARQIDRGRDPSWHPYLTLLVYAASRKIGEKTYDYDLKVSDLRNTPRFLQSSPDIAERWPIWIDADTIIHTAEGTTDLLQLQLKPRMPLSRSDSRTSAPQ